MKKVGDLLIEGNSILKNKKIDTYILDTQLLLGKVLNKDKLWLITNRDTEVEEYKAKEFYNLLEKREKRMPMQYILGSVEFMGIDFYIKEGVLIPRGDTEVLVEEVLERIKEDEKLNLCDLCCGSGAIGLSLATYRKNIKVDLLDIADDPEIVTTNNIKRLNLKDRAEFIKGNLFNEVKKDKKVYDVIVSNPPYIKEEIIETLMEDVKDYEPRLALSGGEDGLDFYRKIIDESKLVLKNKGILAFEIGYDQAEDVKKLMIENNYYDVKIIKDLANLDRVVIGILNLFEKK
ncbi:HemK family methyltransferase [Clostridium fallax]|uniref:Release factor glutamine methyltransferase n=1 Tax=Clostridium fallax TaxID=1533 RepID=A0A1M4WJC6_9CLOT|nr:protein-(glutamine-N5) methyltransferase, release factor-specific [Clostridium fallax]SQB05731.1 HemK family methyltransferase [Clostridium fallax]